MALPDDDPLLHPSAPGFALVALPPLHAAPQGFAQLAPGGVAAAPATGAAAGAADAGPSRVPSGGERLPTEETGYDNTVKVSHSSKVAAGTRLTLVFDPWPLACGAAAAVAGARAVPRAQKPSPQPKHGVAGACSVRVPVRWSLPMGPAVSQVRKQRAGATTHASAFALCLLFLSVAGKIAHSLRAREWPTLLVAGNGSIHTAVKCCITAGRFVQAEGLSIEFEPLFREADHSRALLALAVLPTPAAAGSPRAGGGAAAAGLPAAPALQQEIKVSAHSRHAKVGAALSARLLDAPSRPAVLSALGEAAVANAVMAAAHAAHYLAARGARRLAAQARASIVVKGADQLSGVQLWVWLQGGGGGGLDGGHALGAGYVPDHVASATTALPRPGA